MTQAEDEIDYRRIAFTTTSERHSRDGLCCARRLDIHNGSGFHLETDNDEEEENWKIDELEKECRK